MRVLLGNCQRRETVRVGRASSGRFDDQVLRIDLREDGFGDLALTQLGDDIYVVRQPANPVVRVAQQRAAVSTEWQCVLRPRATRARPQARARSSRRYDGEWFGQARAASSSASSLE